MIKDLRIVSGELFIHPSGLEPGVVRIRFLVESRCIDYGFIIKLNINAMENNIEKLDEFVQSKVKEYYLSKNIKLVKFINMGYRKDRDSYVVSNVTMVVKDID